MTKSLDDFIGEISTNADDTNAAFSVAAPGRRNVSGRENPYFEGSDEVPIAHQVTESVILAPRSPQNRATAPTG